MQGWEGGPVITPQGMTLGSSEKRRIQGCVPHLNIQKKAVNKAVFLPLPPLIQSDTAKKRTIGKAGTLLLQHCLQLFGFAFFFAGKTAEALINHEFHRR